MTEENKSVKNFPNLRFPGFEGEWEVKKLGEIAEIKTGSKDTQNKVDNGIYPFFVRSNTIEKINTYSYDGEAILTSGDGVGVGKNFHYINGKFDFHQRVYSIRNFKTGYDGKYIYNIFSEKFYDRVIRLSAKNSVDSVRMNMISEMKISFPMFNEQVKISSFLTMIGDRIQTQKKIIEGLITLKIQSRNKLFTQIIKGNYEKFTVEEILNYEQPTKYIVSNTDYSSDKSLIPVLTANKAFILGYTDEDWGIYNKGKCIVLDDFTMDLKYVDFPFKVKSSAIKLLTPKNNVDLKFIFEYFSFLNLSSNEHKRHHISEIQPMSLTVPSLEIQKSISDFLLKLDEKVNLETALLNQYENQQKYLLQNLFV